MEFLKELLDQYRIAGPVAEIGTLAGEGSTRVLLDHVLEKGGELYAIDTFQDKEIFQKVKDLLNFPNTQAVQGHSAEVGRSWDKKLDFLFIDGDHGFPHISQDGYQTGVALDILSWHRHIKKGGILAFHDYTGSKTHYGRSSLLDVEYAVDNLCRLPIYKFVGRKGSIVAFEKLEDHVLYPHLKFKMVPEEYRREWETINESFKDPSEIIIYGTGGGGKYVLDSIRMRWGDKPKVIFTDSFVSENGTMWGNNPVIKYKELVRSDTLIVIGSLYEKEIADILHENGKKHLTNFFRHFEFIGWCHLGGICF